MDTNMTATPRLDPVTLEVVRNALPAIANEMAADLQRTSYNMMIFEVHDFCTVLVDTRGKLICQNVGGVSHFIADMGGRRTAEGTEVLYARSQVALAARLAGVSALDQVVTAVRDDDAFRRDAEQARALGYPGKLCIHPSQVALAHEIFTPSDAEVAHAHRVLEASEQGVGLLDGEMVDDVHVRMAHATLSRARPTPTP